MLLNEPGEGAREGLLRDLKGVTYQVPLPLLDFGLGGVCDSRSRVYKTRLKRPPGRPLRCSVRERVYHRMGEIFPRKSIGGPTCHAYVERVKRRPWLGRDPGEYRP